MKHIVTAALSLICNFMPIVFYLMMTAWAVTAVWILNGCLENKDAVHIVPPVDTIEFDIAADPGHAVCAVADYAAASGVTLGCWDPNLCTEVLLSQAAISSSTRKKGKICMVKLSVDAPIGANLRMVVVGDGTDE